MSTQPFYAAVAALVLFATGIAAAAEVKQE
jgi:hypothetical protein